MNLKAENDNIYRNLSQNGQSFDNLIKLGHQLRSQKFVSSIKTIFRLIALPFNALLESYKRRGFVEQLNTMDLWQLDDLGLTPGDIGKLQRGEITLATLNMNRSRLMSQSIDTCVDENKVLHLRPIKIEPVNTADLHEKVFAKCC